MKCVCPMGGDRTCPDNCLLAIYWNLPSPERKKRRKPTAEQLYMQGFTMEAIATQLGVSKVTISTDLKDIVKPINNVERGKDTRGRKKSTGRPKGSGTKRAGPKPERRTTDATQEATAAALVLDQGKTYEQAKAETGMASVQTVKTAVAREEGRREPKIERSDLSLSAQEKFDAAIRAYKQKLQAEFRQNVLDEVKKRIDEIVLPSWKQRIDQAQELYKHRRGAMDKATFNKIRRALHPDSRNSISDKALADAFDTFMGLEKFLLDEKDSPTEIGPLPDSLADWDRMRATAARKRTKRANIARR